MRSFNYFDRFVESQQPIMEDVVVVMDAKSERSVTWGRGMFYLPHGISIDQQHSSLWLTDVAMHQVSGM